jgi:hypothetical protein
MLVLEAWWSEAFNMEVWAIIGVLALSLTLALLCACGTLKVAVRELAA